MEFENTQDPNAFDMGISTLTRINYQLWRCNEESSRNNIQGWFEAVKMVYKETDAFMNKEDKKIHYEKLDEFEKIYQEYLDYVQRWNGLRSKFSSKNVPFKPKKDVFKYLFDWELELRRILDKEGLLMRKGEDAGSTITRM